MSLSRNGLIIIISLVLVAGAGTAYPGPVIVGATVDVGPGFANIFSPDVVNINVGEKVVWTLKKGFHTVTSGACPVDPCIASGLFDSGQMNGIQTFEFTFNTAGTFDYHCQIHGSVMTGQVVVTAQPVCGDGIVNQPTEECDDLNLPTRTCDARCQLIPFCGDGIVNQRTEQCDDLNLPTKTCDAQCQLIPFCGDGIVNRPTEQCEPPNTASCDAQCQLIPFCGDGIVNQPTEQCDDGNTVDNDGCTNTCEFITCGPGTILQVNECVVDPTLTVISEDTILLTSTTVLGDVLIQSNALFKIPSGVTLTIPEGHTITIKAGAALLVEAGGTVIIGSGQTVILEQGSGFWVKSDGNLIVV